MSEWLRKFTIGTGWESTTFNVDVELYPDKPTMLAVAEREYGRQPEGTDALTHCYTDGGEPHALIRFAADDVSVRVVSHEAAHAAVHLAGMLTDSLPEGDDEKIPWLVGSLTSAIWALDLDKHPKVVREEPA
jgi:hypothetical protein